MKPAFHAYATLAVALCVAAAVVSGCGRQKKIRICVSLQPYAFFVEQVGGTRVQVSAMVAPGQTPDNFVPEPALFDTIKKTDLFFTAGLPFEGIWLPKLLAANPRLAVIAMDAGVSRLDMPGFDDLFRPASADRKPGEGGARDLELAFENHDRAGDDDIYADARPSDPSVWLSPERVRRMLENVREALTSADPEGAAEYLRNFQTCSGGISALQNEISERLAWNPGQAFVTFHPVWSYFADEFGLRQVPVEFEGREPEEPEIRNLAAVMTARGISVMVVPSGFPPQHLQALTRLCGARHRTADPYSRDWFSTMRTVSQAFAQPEKPGRR